MNLIEALLRFIRSGSPDLPEGYAPAPHQYENMFCQLLKDTDYPCEESSTWLAGIQNRDGNYQKIYLCKDHNPETDNWTKRFFEIREVRLLDIKPIWHN